MGDRSIIVFIVCSHSRSKLKVTCEGATHTVRSANIGAFALATGTKGAANAAIALLGRSASGSSSSEQKIQRINGALVSMVQGKALAYALFNLQERGSLFIGHGVEVYEGMVIGENPRLYGFKFDNPPY